MAVTTAAAIGMGLAAAGTAYSARQNRKATSSAVDAANAAAMIPGITGYGSFKDPLGRRRLVNGVRKNVTNYIDPSIRSLRERSLGRLPEYRDTLGASYGQYSSDLGGLSDSLRATSDRLRANENPFIQARVNPLLARAEQGRGQLSRGLSRRGLGGSSLYSSALGNYDAEVGREIGDQRALATQYQIRAQQDNISAQLGVDTQRYNAALSSVQALQSLDTAEQAIAAQNLQQELASLGLGQADVSALLQAAGLGLQGAQLQTQTLGAGMDVIGRLLAGGSKAPSQSSGGFFP
jgi:hypothetical protein